MQILTKIYDKTKINWRIKAELSFLLVDFVPFLNFCVGVGHVTVTIKKLRGFGRALNFCSVDLDPFSKELLRVILDCSATLLPASRTRHTPKLLLRPS